MNLQTKGNYQLSDAISALQKEIRRGKEEEAMYWALELEATFPHYLWHRLEVICNEDIGPAAPEVIVLVHTLREQYNDMIARGGQASELLCLSNAILAMCRAEKSRLADNFLTVVGQERVQRGLRREIPDYALDKHTRTGKQQGRGWEFFNKISSLIRNETTKFTDIYKERAEQFRLTYTNLDRNKAGAFERKKGNNKPPPDSTGGLPLE